MILSRKKQENCSGEILVSNWGQGRQTGPRECSKVNEDFFHFQIQALVFTRKCQRGNIGLRRGCNKLVKKGSCCIHVKNLYETKVHLYALFAW